MADHPLQPLEQDKYKVIRFKDNKIVQYVLDNGGVDLNQITRVSSEEGFSRDDRIQFAQLIGYSVNGFGELSYVTDRAYERAATMEEGLKNGEKIDKLMFIDSVQEMVRKGYSHEDLMAIINEMVTEEVVKV
jgi:hypothetical protein